jgi:hypothetical protein
MRTIRKLKLCRLALLPILLLPTSRAKQIPLSQSALGRRWTAVGRRLKGHALGTADFLSLSVTIGAQEAQLVSAIAVGNSPGMYQVTTLVPDGVSGGSIPVMITIAGQTSRW